MSFLLMTSWLSLWWSFNPCTAVNHSLLFWKRFLSVIFIGDPRHLNKNTNMGEGRDVIRNADIAYGIKTYSKCSTSYQNDMLSDFFLHLVRLVIYCIDTVYSDYHVYLYRVSCLYMLSIRPLYISICTIVASVILLTVLL